MNWHTHRLWPKPGDYRNAASTDKKDLQSLVPGIKQDDNSSYWDVIQKDSE